MAPRKPREPRAIERMRALHAGGDVAAARLLAWAIVNDPAASAADREEARAYRTRTDVDRRALAIGLSALGLGMLVVVVFILLR